MRKWFSEEDEAAAVSEGPRFLRRLPRATIERERYVLASGPCAQVELCACGTAHLTLGATTLKLPVHDLVRLHELLGEALTRLERAEAADRVDAPATGRN